MLNEYYYVWISLISDLDYDTFIKLIAPLKFELKKLYEISFSKKGLYSYLSNNSIYISNRIYNLLVDNKIKNMAFNLYNFIKENNILIIHVFSKMYKKIFKHNFNQSLVIYLYGNIILLKNRKYLVYSEKNSKEVLYMEDVIKNNIEKNGNVILNCNIKNKTNENQIIVASLNELLNKNLQKNNLYIFASGNLYYNLACFCDELIIINAKYKKNIIFLVDTLLDLGKEISVIPNNIFDKNAYFSNYLLSEGAKVIYNLKEI